MSTPEPPAVESEALRQIVNRGQVWETMAAKYGVENPVPPWKTSLDGLCDALDHAACDTTADTAAPSFKERRDEEDALSATRYADIPYPESQLLSLAQSLMVRGLITESELQHKLSVIRERLEA